MMKVQLRVAGDRTIQPFATALNQLNQTVQYWAPTLAIAPTGETIPAAVSLTGRTDHPIELEPPSNTREFDDDKQAERNSTRTTEDLDRFFSVALDLLCIANTDGYFLRLNPAWEKTLGYSSEELKSKQFAELVHPDDLESTQNAISQLLEHREVINFVNRYRHRDGSYRCIEWRSILIDDKIYAAARDITEHEAAKARLQQNEIQQRALIEALPDLIMRVTGEGVYLDFLAARNFQVIGGKDLIGTRVEDSLPPDLAQLRIAAIQAALQTGELQVYEQEIWINDTLRVEECRVLAYGDNEVLIIGRDITEQKQAEVALRQSEAKNRAMLAAIPDLLLRIKQDGTCLDFIPPSTTPEPGFVPVHTNVAEILSPEIWQYQQQRMEQAFATGELQVWEHQISRYDTLCTEEVRLVHYKDDEFLVIVRDISERKRVEAALQESEERFRQIAETVREGFFVFEPASSCYSYVNPAYTAITGMSPQLLYEQGTACWEACLHPDDRERIRKQLQQEVQGEIFDEEYRFIHSDDSVRWVRAQAFPIWDHNGSVVRVVGTIQDITDRKQAELALSQSQAVQKAIIQAIPDLLIRMDREGLYKERSSSHYLRVLLPPQPSPTSTVHDVLPAALAEQRLHYARLALETGVLQVYEQTLEIDNQLCYEEVRIVPLLEQEVLVIVRDITDRKRAELALSVSQERLQTLIDALPFGVWVRDSRDRLVVQNAVDIARYGNQVGTNLEILPDLAKHYSLYHHIKAHYPIGQFLTYETTETVAGEERCFLRVTGSLPDTNGEKGVFGAVIDITARKQTEVALQESEERRRLALDLTGTGSWEFDLATGEAIWSNSHYRLMGLVPGEVPSNYHTWRERVHPEDREWVEAAFSHAITTRSLLVLEYRVVYPDGTVRWVLTKGQGIIDPTGQVVRMLGVMIDISDRKSAEEALRRSEERWQLAIEGSNDGIWDHNLITGEHFLSPRCMEILGYDYEEIDSFERWLVHVHPEDQPILKATFQAYLERKTQIYALEYRMRCKDGSDKWLLARGKAIWDETGRPVRAIGSVSDVTLRKQAEADLQQLNAELEQRVWERTQDVQQAYARLQDSEARFQTFMNNSPTVSWISDLDGTKVYVSQNYYSAFQLLTPDVIGRAIDEVFPEDIAQQHLNDIQAVINTNQILETVKSCPRPDGTVGDFLVYEFPLVDSSGQCLIGGIAIDITERKQAEAAVQQSEQDLRTIFNNVYDAILIHEIDGTILDANDRALELRGATREQLLAATITDLSAPDAPIDRLPELLQRVQAGETMRFEWREQRFDDHSIYDVEVSLRQVVLRNRPVFIAGVRDISDRKQAERALRESQQFIQTILNTVPLSIFWKNQHSTFLGCNQHLANLMGLASTSEMIGRTGFEFSPTEAEATAYNADDQQVMESGAAKLGIQETITLPTGEQRWIETHKTPLRDWAGNVVGIVGVFQDITDRKQAEEALQEERLRLQLALEAAQMGTWSCNLYTGKLIWSDRAQEIFGFVPGTFPGNRETFLSLVHPDDRDRVIQEITHTFETGAPYNIEYRIYRLDGEVRWLAVWGIIPKDLPMSDRQLIGVVADITDRKQAEVALADSEERFRVTFEQAAVGIVQVDLTGRFVRSNQKFCDLVGYSEFELSSRTFKDITHPDDIGPDQSHVDRLLSGEAPSFVMEKRYIRRNGEIVWANLSVSLVRDLSNAPQYFIAVVENISDRKRAEQDLQESRNMLALVLDAIPQRVFWKDRQSRFLGCNSSFANDYQLTCEYIVGKTDLELPWAQWAHLYQADDANVINTRLPKLNYEEPTNKLNGEQIWIRSSKIPLTNSEGEVIGVLGCYDDITDRKRAEEALQESRNMLKLVLDTIPQRVFWKDHQSRYLGCNPAFANDYQLTYDEIVGKTDLELPWAQWAERFQNADKKVMNTRTSELNYEEIVNNSNGEQIWIRSSKIPLTNSQGELIGVLGYYDDITDRKRAEEALRDNEERLRLALTAANLGLYDLNIQTGEAIVSSEYATMLGYDPATFRESNAAWIERLHPDDQAVVAAAYRAYVAGEVPEYKVEFRQRTHEGQWKWILSIGKIVAWDEAGQPLRMLGTHTDIDERKRSEQALLESQQILQQQEQFLREIYEGVNFPIFVINVHGSNDFRYSDWNSAAELASGYSRHTIRGMTPEEVYGTVNGNVERQRLLRSMQTGLPTTYEERLTFEGQQETWWRTNISPLKGADGKIHRFVGVTFDITERKQAEEALQQLNLELEQRVNDRTLELKKAMEVAEAANRAKSTFLANMSHELRTPLNAILGFAQLMSHDYTLNADHRDQLGIINRSGEHLLNLINDILEMSKIEAGQVSFHPDVFDLYALLQTLEEMFRLRATEKGLQFQFDRAHPVPQYIKTDENKLRQVLINLIGNAIKFTPKGYVILHVTAAEPESDRSPQSSQSLTLSFAVEDTGVGINPNEVERLFEPFVQSENRQISQEGTGLGLPISRQFVQMMGGELLVCSTPGQGSIFRFHIQAQLAEASHLPARPLLRQVISLAPNQPTYRILVVEDQETNRQLLLQLLQSVGFEVQVATNGQEAIALWESWHPQIIWMDMRMPVLNGYEATQQIRLREQQAQSHPPTVIIALTANVFEEERARALNVGCNDFVRKPFQEAELLQKMAHYLGAEYLYAEDNQAEIDVTTALHPSEAIASLQTLPASWLNLFYQATIQLDSVQMIILIDQIAPEQPVLAALLRQKLENFDLQQILDLLQDVRQMGD